MHFQKQAPEADGHTVTYEWVPIVISALFAYIVADCFIDVYGVRVWSTLSAQSDLLTQCNDDLDLGTLRNC